MVQKGPVPANKLNANYPLTVAQDEYQAESRNPKGFNIMTDSGKMPTITLEQKKSGTIGSTEAISPASVYPAAIPASTGDPEANLRTQFIQENAFDNAAAEQGGPKNPGAPRPNIKS